MKMVKAIAAATEAGREDIVKQVMKISVDSPAASPPPPIRNMRDQKDVPFWNLPSVRQAEVPSRGGLASARGLAVIAGHLAR